MNTKLCRIVLAGLTLCLGASCTTAYDAYGYPQQVVDPGVAVAGAAAAGLLAYGLANNHNHRHYRSYHHGHYRSHGYRHHGHHGHYYRPSHYRSYRGGHGHHH